MDSSIPIGKRWSIGLDGIVGLFPRCRRPGWNAGLGADRSERHSGRIATGSGGADDGQRGGGYVARAAFLSWETLFDFAFKANTKNIRIYREHLEGRQQTVRNWIFTFLVVLSLCLH